MEALGFDAARTRVIPYGVDVELFRPDEARRARWRARVHLPGPVQHDELPDLYRAADLFVLPAVHDARRNVDGLPNVVLEAMASGLPVVASAISGLPLAVVEGETGRLVPEGDRAALVDAVAALAASPALRREQGAAGRRRAERELTWDAVARRYREAYELAIERPVVQVKRGEQPPAQSA